MSAILPFLPLIAQAGAGIGQAIFGSSIKDDRPTYEMPEEYSQVAGILKGLSSRDMPGMRFGVDSVNRNQSNMMSNVRRAASSPGQIMEAAVKGQINSNNSTEGLMAQNQGWQDRQMQAFLGQMNLIGGQREKEFQLNEYEPWKMNFDAKTQFQGAGMENIFSALTNSASMLGAQGTTDAFTKALEQMMGGTGSGAGAGASDGAKSASVNSGSGAGIPPTLQSWMSENLFKNMAPKWANLPK